MDIRFLCEIFCPKDTIYKNNVYLCRKNGFEYP